MQFTITTVEKWEVLAVYTVEGDSEQEAEGEVLKGGDIQPTSFTIMGPSYRDVIEIECIERVK